MATDVLGMVFVAKVLGRGRKKWFSGYGGRPFLVVEYQIHLSVPHAVTHLINPKSVDVPIVSLPNRGYLNN